VKHGPIAVPFLDVTLVVVVLTASPASAAQSCQSRASLKLPDTTITSAMAVLAGPFSIPGPPPPVGTLPNKPTMLPSFCRIEAKGKPAIKLEVWMPARDWNGNL